MWAVGNSWHREAIIAQTEGKASFSYDTKWYNFEDDMREYSKQYPEIIFQVLCEGEDFGDYRTCYFQNGKMQEVRVTIEPFDVEKLT